jgi:hypothetical protein
MVRLLSEDFPVIVFLALVWARGLAVIKARLHLDADLEGSGWICVMIFRYILAKGGPV